jgi:hypothetical protein
MAADNDDCDRPWKTAITAYFPAFMAFCCPDASRAIDWTVPPIFLEQELAQVLRDAALSRAAQARYEALYHVDRMPGRRNARRGA